jgi:hypothetical protein
VRDVFVTAATVAIVFTTPASPLAHRLDEYLQAARVSIARTHVALELDLTPGIEVAGDIVPIIDRDADRRITPLEAEAYGRAVLADTVLELDGRAVTLTLAHIEVPSIDEMRHGMGAIQLRGTGSVQPGALWRYQRRLHFRNNHRPDSSVYLVNALIPSDPDVTVVSQTRDAKQRDALIAFSVSPRWPKYLYWPAVGLMIGGWWLMKRTVSPPLTTNH